MNLHCDLPILTQLQAVSLYVQPHDHRNVGQHRSWHITVSTIGSFDTKRECPSVPSSLQPSLDHARAPELPLCINGVCVCPPRAESPLSNKIPKLK